LCIPVYHMRKQAFAYPNTMSPDQEYFDGEVTWDFMDTTDDFYNDELRRMIPRGKKHGEFESKDFIMNFIWMDVDEYIRHQIHALKFDDPADRAFSAAISGMDYDEYLEDPDYDPMTAFVMSSDQDVVDSIVYDITTASAIFPVGILVYLKDGVMSDYQEGRHRSLALHKLGINFIPVWTFQFKGRKKRD